jgi:Ca2+-binding EF-hand superfamily protein
LAATLDYKTFLSDTKLRSVFSLFDTDGNNSITAEDLHATIKRALSSYRQQEVWKKLQQNAMSQDFSWEKSAARYEEIYTSLLNT